MEEKFLQHLEALKDYYEYCAAEAANKADFNAYSACIGLLNNVEYAYEQTPNEEREPSHLRHCSSQCRSRTA